MSKPIPPLDLMWLIMETQASPTHVGALLLFEKPKGRPVVREIVEAYRSYKPTPPFNYIPEVGGTSMPRFHEATSYDPRYHIQHIALPKGATRGDLLRLVADLHEPMLDRGRPLFRNWIIDDVPENQFAIYTKVHHAIIDGVSGTKRLYASLSSSAGRQAIPKPAFAADAPVRQSRPPEALVDRIAELGLSAKTRSVAIRDVSVGAIKKRFAMLLGAGPVGNAPFTAHRGPMNEPLQMARSVATLSLPLDQMHAVGKHYGATLNDVAVTVVDEGMHRYLRQTGRTFPHRLVAFCPVSLRDDGDTATGTRVSAIFVHLGEHAATVIERIGQVVASMGTAKQELRAMSKDAAMTYAVALLGLAELAAATHVDRVAPPLANMVISNVPGERQQMYLNGAALLGTFPVSAIAMSIGLNATLTSYNDNMDFGFVGSGATMHDLPELARHVLEAYAELAAASKRGTARGHSKQTPRKRARATRS